MVKIIGIEQRAANAAREMVDALQVQTRALTEGRLDDAEVDKVAAGAALDLIEQVFRVQHPGGSAEALVSGVFMIVARQLRIDDGLTYEQATATLLAAFQTSWLALDDEIERTPPGKPVNGSTH